jgi:hypothetical protein
MAINVTRWSPDTCTCVLEYSWDDTAPEDSRVHNITNVVQKCAAHAGTPDLTTHWNIINEENPRKNVAFQHLVDNFPAQLSNTGAAGGTLKSGISFGFSYSGTAPNRVLTVTFTGITLTNQQRTSIQNTLNTKFGAGKVLLG